MNDSYYQPQEFRRKTYFNSTHNRINQSGKWGKSIEWEMSNQISDKSSESIYELL